MHLIILFFTRNLWTLPYLSFGSWMKTTVSPIEKTYSSVNTTFLLNDGFNSSCSTFFFFFKFDVVPYWMKSYFLFNLIHNAG